MAWMYCQRCPPPSITRDFLGPRHQIPVHMDCDCSTDHFRWPIQREPRKPRGTGLRCLGRQMLITSLRASARTQSWDTETLAIPFSFWKPASSAVSALPVANRWRESFGERSPEGWRSRLGGRGRGLALADEDPEPLGTGGASERRAEPGVEAKRSAAQLASSPVPSAHSGHCAQHRAAAGPSGWTARRLCNPSPNLAAPHQPCLPYPQSSRPPPRPTRPCKRSMDQGLSSSAGEV
jgi:hypothetical protein